MLRRRRIVGGYRASDYQRPLLKRLTPFTWLLISLITLGVIAMVYLVLDRIVTDPNVDQSLPRRLARDTNAALTATPMPSAGSSTVAAAKAPVDSTSTVSAMVVAAKAPVDSTSTFSAMVVVTDAPAPVLLEATATEIPATSRFVSSPPTPTTDPHGASWQGQLVRLPDGTLMAPDAIVARAKSDIGDYYNTIRDLPLDQYLTKRESIFSDYFAGPALEGIRQDEKNRRQYLLNRSGQVDIQVRDFSANGLSASVFISSRSWTNDVYDIRTGNLVEKGRVDRNTMTKARILFERATQRWKFAIIEQIFEVNTR